MSRFLFTVWPLTGHVYPNLSIARELAAMGHEVAIYTGAKYRELVESEGFRHFPLQKVDEAHIDEMFMSHRGIQGAKTPWRRRAMWRECVLDTIPAQLEDLDAVLTSWSPQVIVCDATMWAPFLVLHESRHIPVAIFSLIPACHLAGPQGPVMGIPMPRPVTAWQRQRARVLRVLSDFFLREIRQRADEFRRQAGLPRLTCTPTNHGGLMPLYLVPGSPEFDYERTDLPRSVQYVGPCLWKGKDEALPDWIAGLPADQPLVYASEGTVHLEPRVLRAVAQGLGGLPIQVIMTTGKHRDPSTLDLGVRPLPPNIHVRQWVPLNALIPKLSAMVTIGGPGTMMAAIEAGIPVVIVPFAWDHPEAGWRLQASGAGILLQPHDCTPGNMRRAVERVLADPSYRENALRLAGTFTRLGGSPEAARKIAALAGDPPGGKEPFR
jgi:MGT family glycosyltransferase